MWKEKSTKTEQLLEHSKRRCVQLEHQVLDLSGKVEEFASQLVDRAHANEDEQVQKLMVHNANFLEENNRLKNDLGKSKME